MPEGHKPVLSLGAKLPEVAVAASNVLRSRCPWTMEKNTDEAYL